MSTLPAAPQSISLTPTPEHNRLVVQPNLYTDGYISHMFTPEDAMKYICSFFKHESRYLAVSSPPSNSPGAFYLTRRSRTIAIDYANLSVGTRLTQGTVVPQRIWVPRRTDHWTNGRFSTAELDAPLWFLQCDDTPGIRLSDVSASFCEGLKDSGKTIEVNNSSIHATLHIAWPGYEDWRGAMRLKQHSGMTTSQLCQNVARELRKFLRDNENVRPTKHPEWAVGPGGITEEDIILIGLLHVSLDRWQPILQLNRHIIEDTVRL